ncbi:MAG TPA: hypothetical protein PK967_20500 [Candidatus Hydrogenedentes bacterium]|nr:hypothetical protein [Candidatus Hydrogenedentota bacterium]
MTTRTNETIISQSRTNNLTGGTIRLFFTFDGRWYRVRTNFETFTKVRIREKAETSFKQLEAA